MDKGMKPHVLDYLRAQLWDGDFKRQVLAGWGYVVGAVITGDDANSIAASGWKTYSKG